MINKSKKTILAFSILSFFCLANLALAQTGSYNFANDSGLNKTADSAGYSADLKAMTPESLASGVISKILMFLGVVFLGLMIYGGITWMTSGGNEKKVDTAKETITAGIIGLIIVIGAYALSYFIIQYFGSKSLN